MDSDEKKRLKQQRRREIQAQFRETARKEIEGRTMGAKIWRQALTESDGDDELAREIYTRLRVDNLREEYRKLARQAVQMDKEHRAKQEGADLYLEEQKQEKVAKRRSAKRKQGESDLTYIAIMIVVVAGIIAVIRAMT
jgi:hypothetical protein